MIEIIPTLSPNKKGQRWNKIDISVTPLVYWLNLGNGTQYKIITFRVQDALFLGIERIGCFLFGDKCVKAPAYIAEKLNLDEIDANNVADWFNIQLGLNVPEFGRYDDSYCIDDHDEVMREGLESNITEKVID